MKALLVVPVLLLVAACDVPNNSTRQGAGGGAEIQLQDGRNCWDNQCLQYNPRRGTFSISGRHSVTAPAGALKGDGYITVSGFQQAFHRAMRAPSLSGWHR